MNLCGITLFCYEVLSWVHTSHDHTLPPQTISRRRIGVLEGALIHWRSRLRPKPQKDLANQRPVTLRKRRENVKSEANWKLFYHKFACDHATSALIWNYKVRGGACNPGFLYNEDKIIAVIIQNNNIWKLLGLETRKRESIAFLTLWFSQCFCNWNIWCTHCLLSIMKPVCVFAGHQTLYMCFNLY